jgi:hypothetical protein
MKNEIVNALYIRDKEIDELKHRLNSLENFLNIEYQVKSPDQWQYPKYVKKNITTEINIGVG